MIIEQIYEGGCASYLIGCEETHIAAVIDPNLQQRQRYDQLAQQHGLRIAWLVDTHTHADHFTAAQQMGRKLEASVVMHRSSPAPFCDMRVDDGETILVGNLRLEVLHTPGHTSDSMCLLLQDHAFTGDTLLIGGTGRTDLPTGDPEALWDSLFNKLLKRDPETKVHPGHNYKHAPTTTLAQEIENNPRLQKREREAFVAQMQALDLNMPRHLTEALRVNSSGGQTVAQLISDAQSRVPFMSMEEVRRRIEAGEQMVILDIREKDAYEAGHLPTARHLPRGQLELRVNSELPDPTLRVVSCCEFGKISTLAAATLQALGYQRAVALDGGVRAWKEAGFPIEGE